MALRLEITVTEQSTNGWSFSEATFTIDDIAQIRRPIGKLLAYDGERYGLFHDRFKYFLVGEQPDPIEEALRVQDANTST